MKTSRRSFLALLAGSLAVRPDRLIIPDLLIVPAYQPRRLKVQDSGLYTCYTVWDTAIAEPGQVFNAELFPPPLPTEFRISSMGVDFDESLPIKDLREVTSAVRLDFSKNGLTMFAGPLAVLTASVGRMFPVFPELTFAAASDQLHVTLRSLEKIEASIPVPIRVILRGSVRLRE